MGIASTPVASKPIKLLWIIFPVESTSGVPVILIPSTRLPEIVFCSPAVFRPIILLLELRTSTPIPPLITAGSSVGSPLGIAVFPAPFVPIKLPRTLVSLELLAIKTPLIPFPEITLRFGPVISGFSTRSNPISLFVEASIRIPLFAFGTAASPAALTPMKFPRIVLSLAAFTINTPSAPFPEIVFPSPGLTPPIVLSVEASI